MRKEKTNKLTLLLILIVALAFFLRVYKLSTNPPALNWDEVSHGYNAYSILNLGSDEWGHKLPTIFQAYGDYKLPVYIYITAISEAVFGLNEFAVRFPSAIAGTVSVFLSYLLYKELFGKLIKDKMLEVGALTGALLVAIEPWSLFLSRPAFEANLALMFFVGGLYLLLKSVGNFKYISFAMILLGLTVWTYNSYRIFTPIILVCFAFLNRSTIISSFRKNRLNSLLATIIFFILFVPMILQLLNFTGTARYSKVAIIDEGAIGNIVNIRDRLEYSPAIERLVINKYSYFFYNFVLNWIRAYSPKFIFIQGGSNYQFSLPNHGLIYFVNLPFLIIGLVRVLKNFKKTKVIILFILTAPVAASLTREAPHVLRNITLLPIPMFLSSLGLITIAQLTEKFTGENKKSTLLRVLPDIKTFIYLTYLLTLIISSQRYLTEYFGKYPQKYSWSWQFGYKQISSFVKANYADYDKIIVTKKYGEPHEFLLFYLGWSPKNYLNDPLLVRYQQSGWYWVDSFDKFIFVNEWDIPSEEWQSFKTERDQEVDCSEIRCLLITDNDSVPKTWNKIATINYLDDRNAFTIFNNK